MNTAPDWIPAIRKPDGCGEPYCFIQRHEHTHGLRPAAAAALCGYKPVSGWIERSRLVCEVTCRHCRQALGLGALTMPPEHPQFSPFLRY